MVWLREVNYFIKISISLKIDAYFYEMMVKRFECANW